MDADPAAVWFRLAVLAGVLYAGGFARRRRLLGEPATRALGRVCTDVCFPCLTFTQMLRVIGSWPAVEQAQLLLLGAMLLSISIAMAGWLTRRLPDGVRRAAWLSAATPNWIFLPLPIAALMYGAEGVATVLLVNVAAQFFLWTVCVGILRGFRNTLREGWTHAVTPGLLATVLGAAVAALWPESRTWFDRPDWMGRGLNLVAGFGTLTIPLSMLVTGSQLGALPPGWRIDAAVRRVLWARLLVIPAVTAVLVAASSYVFPLYRSVFHTAVLIAAMPAAISCGVLVERYGGDRDLVSRAILYSTVFAFATVPLFMLAAHTLFR